MTRLYGETALGLAWVIALAASLAVLFIGEVLGQMPCTLCWYQRIAMYPLAVILPLGAFFKDGSVRLYAGVLATIGAGIALYHRLLQAFPSLDTGTCSAFGPSCSSPLIKQFGFVTIPYMALSGFLLILALLYADRANSARAVPSFPASTEPTPAIDD